MARKEAKPSADESWAEEGVAAATPQQLEALNRELQEMVEMEALVDQMEEDLKEAKKNLHNLRNGRVPDLMAQMGIDSIGFQGWDVTIDDFVSGSLPKDPEKKKAAVAYLTENDGAGMIKTMLSIAFTKNQHNEALALADDLKLKGYEAEVESGVHASTLCAWARERKANGEPLDAEVLGLYTGRVAKAKPRKEKKAKAKKEKQS